MADWQEQLNTILSDPDAMAQIVSLAQSISGQPPAPEPASGKDADGGAAPEEKPPDAEALRAVLGGLDPELLRRLMPLVRQLNRPESSDAALFLRSLRPFLSEKRRDKVERAAQLARLVHLGKTFLTAQEQEAQGV